jgi:pimeloyl-ACP methyl ester carboxylesterase
MRSGRPSWRGSTPSGGTMVEGSSSLLRFQARDGFVVRGHLVIADGAARDAPVLLRIHGSLGHFLARGTPRLLPHALQSRGIHSLSVNTRLASTGQMTSVGVFDDTRWDAAVAVLTGEGFRNIFVLGYSLGAAMVVHWAAAGVHPDVRGLVLEGVSYSPRRRRTRPSHSPPRHRGSSAPRRARRPWRPPRQLAADATPAATTCWCPNAPSREERAPPGPSADRVHHRLEMRSRRGRLTAALCVA